jgi:hypothetical protein
VHADTSTKPAVDKASKSDTFEKKMARLQASVASRKQLLASMKKESFGKSKSAKV